MSSQAPSTALSSNRAKIYESNRATKALTQCDMPMVLTIRRPLAGISVACCLLLLTGCDPTASLNDLMTLASHASDDKRLLEQLVKDVKTAPLPANTTSGQPASSKSLEPNQLSEAPTTEARVQSLQTMYNDAVAAQQSLLTILDLGRGHAKDSELENAVNSYEAAANRFLQSATAEVSSRYGRSKGLLDNATVPSGLPIITIDRSILVKAFTFDRRLRPSIITSFKTNMILTPWSEL